jgi:hypothetical protein
MSELGTIDEYKKGVSLYISVSWDIEMRSHVPWHAIQSWQDTPGELISVKSSFPGLYNRS